MLSTKPLVFTSVVVAALWSGACAQRRAERARAEAAAAEQAAEQVEVIALRFASADSLAPTLRNTLSSPSLRIQDDARTNSVILAGPKSEIERAKRVIAQLDIEVRKQP